MTLPNKLVRPLLAGTAVCVMALTANTAKADGIRTYLDGRPLTFDVAPVSENERTLVPMRLLLEPLGATVAWDQATQTATAKFNGKEVRVKLGSKTAFVNGKPMAMDVPARPIGGRTMVPLRFVSEHLGISVSWEQATHSIYLSHSGVAQPPRPVTPSPPAPTVHVAPPTPVVKANAVVAEAKRLVGTGYSWGGTSPSSGFDCSGFLFYLGKQFGVSLPRTSYDQFGAGTAVARTDLRAGDLLFFTTYQDGPSHVGLYNGQGEFIHSQNETTGVTTTELSNPWWSARYVGARRVFP